MNVTSALVDFHSDIAVANDARPGFGKTNELRIGSIPVEGNDDFASSLSAITLQEQSKTLYFDGADGGGRSQIRGFRHPA